MVQVRSVAYLCSSPRCAFVTAIRAPGNTSPAHADLREASRETWSENSTGWLSRGDPIPSSDMVGDDHRRGLKYVVIKTLEDIEDI